MPTTDAALDGLGAPNTASGGHTWPPRVELEGQRLLPRSTVLSESQPSPTLREACLGLQRLNLLGQGLIVSGERLNLLGQGLIVSGERLNLLGLGERGMKQGADGFASHGRSMHTLLLPGSIAPGTRARTSICAMRRPEPAEEEPTIGQEATKADLVASSPRLQVAAPGPMGGEGGERGVGGVRRRERGKWRGASVRRWGLGEGCVQPREVVCAVGT